MAHSRNNANLPPDAVIASFRPKFRTIRSKTPPGQAGFLRKLGTDQASYAT